MTPVAGVCRLVVSMLLVSAAGRCRAEPNDQLILAWTGQTELGFVRVELWTPDPKEPRASRLVIKCATLPGVMTHAGQMVALPDDIRTDPNVTQLFVVSADDMVRNPRGGAHVLAALTLDGTLRLYGVGPCVFRTRPTLKPS